MTRGKEGKGKERKGKGEAKEMTKGGKERIGARVWKGEEGRFHRKSSNIKQ